jgi:hypothetical protein
MGGGGRVRQLVWSAHWQWLVLACLAEQAMQGAFSGLSTRQKRHGQVRCTMPHDLPKAPSVTDARAADKHVNAPF